MDKGRTSKYLGRKSGGDYLGMRERLEEDLYRALEFEVARGHSIDKVSGCGHRIPPVKFWDVCGEHDAASNLE